MDPNVKGNRRVLSRKAFDARWKTKGRSGIVVTPKRRGLGEAAKPRSRVPWVVGIAAVVVTAGAVAFTVHRMRRA